MRRVFVDTSGWMMMADAADPKHGAARGVRDRFLGGGGILLTSDYVVDETLTLLRIRLGLAAAEEWWRQIEGSLLVRLELIDPNRAELARAWFFRWEDKDFSFTDCTSFVLMRELRLRRALASDRHFVQAGFEVVP